MTGRDLDISMRRWYTTHMGLDEPAIWTVEEITWLSTAYWKSCVLSAAVEIGLFDAVGNGATIDSIAGATNASSPRHIAELLGALVSLELIEKKGDTFHLSPSASVFLMRSSPTCMLDALRFNMDLYPLWGRLGTCIKEGKPVLPPSAHLGDDPARTRRFTLGMHSRALAMAPALIPSLDMRGCSSLLDVGAGPGTFSRVLAEKYSTLAVTLFDLAPVLDIGRELMRGADVTARVSFHSGDYRKDALPGGFDAVLYCGALHQEEPEGARRLFKKIHGSLKPGGRLYVVDMMLAADRTRPLFSVLFSLNMMLISPRGRVFTEDDVLECSEQAGFSDAECLKPEGCPYWVVKALKPG